MHARQRVPLGFTRAVRGDPPLGGLSTLAVGERCDVHEIYLRDHHAAASAGVALAQRAAASDRKRTRTASPLTEVASEIEADARVLDELMMRLGVGRAARRTPCSPRATGRPLKPNGVSSTLAAQRRIEPETLVVGETTGSRPWEQRRDAGIAEDEVDRLVTRAERQRETVEACRRAAAGRAFAAGT